VTPETVEGYYAACRPEVRAVLERIRATVLAAVPGAEERMSYRMPTFFLGGVLVHVGAFKGHIGLFPPVKGDAKLMAAVAPWAGPKGNLRFPLDRPVPYALIARIVKARARLNREKTTGKRPKR
jgi:uncharacterized protein YdhG (YjbR/CyaY superfamily)